MSNKNVSLRAVLLALLITIPNSYWLMINWGPSGYGTGQSFPTVSTVYFNVIFVVLVLMALNPLLRTIRKSASLTDAELMVVYLPRIHRILHRRTRHAPNIVAPTHLPYLVCKSRERMGRTVPPTHARLAHDQRAEYVGDFLSRRCLTSHRPTPTPLDDTRTLVVCSDYRANVHDVLHHDSHPTPVGKPRKTQLSCHSDSATPYRKRWTDALKQPIISTGSNTRGGNESPKWTPLPVPCRTGFRRESL